MSSVNEGIKMKFLFCVIYYIILGVFSFLLGRILPKFIPPKKMTADYGSRLPRMLQETCVAEFIHVLLSILGFGAVFIVGGAWGWIISIVYFLAGNLPYIIIQRYNRPRLLRLEDGMKKQGGCA